MTSPDLFTPVPVFIAQMNADRFTPEFLLALPGNLKVFEAFEREALKVARTGRDHYSARTIVEVLRHNSALADADPTFKLNDWWTPGYARLFMLLHTEYPGFFELRRVNTKHWEGATA